MKKFQFDLTNQILLSTFDPTQFKLFCSRSRRHSNKQLAIDQKLFNIIETAIKVKNQINSEISTPLNRKNNNKLCPNWAFSEFKFFTWVIYLYSFFNGLDLASLTNKDLVIVGQYFPNKPFMFLVYQYKCLLNGKKKKWTTQQDQTLIKIIRKCYGQKEDKINWKVVAYQIFDMLGMKVCRNYKECSERWANHLNPAVNRSKWSRQEDKLLFSLVKTYGKRWSKLNLKMKMPRTQHMIKNRFNSYITKLKKVVPHKSQAQYIDEIISYLSATGPTDQRQFFNTMQAKEGSFQQKEIPLLKQFNKINDLKILKSKVGEPVDKQRGRQAIEQQELKTQIVNYHVNANFQIKNKDSQDKLVNNCVSQMQPEKKYIDNMKFIPQYMDSYVFQNEIRPLEQLPKHANIYFQKDPFSCKAADDTWLSQLEQKENLKWLQRFQE